MSETKKQPNSDRISAMKIMDALSAVDEELLARCRAGDIQSASSRTARQKNLWRRTGTWAAVMCMALLGAAAYGGYQFVDNIRFDSSYSEGGMDGAAAGQSCAEEMEMAMDLDLTDADVRDVQGIQTEGGEEAGGIQNEADGDVRDGGGENGAVSTDGLKDKLLQKNGEPEEELTDKVTESCGTLAMEKYTLEQAAALEGLGSYVPEKLPAGYAFEEAHRNLDMEEPNLTVGFSRGMDYLMLNIQETSAALESVDVGKPETYDVRLYDIPYADSVPQEYRQTFDNPVFAWEDMSLEIVESRMKSYTDAGDSATPRGNFSVLFPDGILVRFNGRGTAKQIWEMFEALYTTQ